MKLQFVEFHVTETRYISPNFKARRLGQYNFVYMCIHSCCFEEHEVSRS